jgi:hypothetical protein
MGRVLSVKLRMRRQPIAGGEFAGQGDDTSGKAESGPQYVVREKRSISLRFATG